MAISSTDQGCGCPPTERPAVGGINHLFITVNNLERSRSFYAALMPRLGYVDFHDYGAVLGWSCAGGSFWLKEAEARYAGETFSKDRVGLCEVAFAASTRAQVDELARAVGSFGGRVLDAPSEYPEYRTGYYALFFADPDGIKLELVHIPE